MDVFPDRWAKTQEDPLGRGGQAHVYLVRDKTGSLDGRYALKLLPSGASEKARARFVREVTAIQRVEHPNVIRILDHSSPESPVQFYVMEFLEDAKTLKDLLGTNDNPFSGNPVSSLTLGIQLFSAIEAWEKSGIVHRDISPGNVLIVPFDNDAKVIDFGICQVEAGAGEMLTSVDEGMGTRNYTAPELEVGGTGTVSCRADVYSAAKVLWSAATNEKAPPGQKPILNGAKRMGNMLDKRLPDLSLVHLQQIFNETILDNQNSRWTPARAREACQEYLAIAKDGFFALEVLLGNPMFDYMAKRCHVCGIGNLEESYDPELVNKNINPNGSNYRVYECKRCGAVSVSNRKVAQEYYKRVRELE